VLSAGGGGGVVVSAGGMVLVLVPGALLFGVPALSPLFLLHAPQASAIKMIVPKVVPFMCPP
jgi:hypothetical protein